MVLDEDVTSEQADDIITALKLIKGVLAVEFNVTDINTTVAELRIKRELTEKLWNVLYPSKENK